VKAEDGKWTRRSVFLKTNVCCFSQNSKCQKDAGELRRCSTGDLDSRDFQLKHGDTKFMLTQDIANARHRGQNRYPKLSEFRANLVNSLIRQFDRYFPEGSMAMFNVLVPSNLPTSPSETLVYAPKIYDLAEKFELDQVATGNEFQMLLKSLIYNR
jgi:hypothetical protein